MGEKMMEIRATRFSLLAAVLLTQACGQEAAAPTGGSGGTPDDQNQLLAPTAADVIAQDLLLTCSNLYDVALTTGGDTYYTSSDCSGQAYAVDGFCTSEPYQAALSTFGCSRDFTSCQEATDMHSVRLSFDPDSCRSFSPDGSDFVKIVYDASWNCCNDAQCSGTTPACASAYPYAHTCVECTSDSYCSGSTPVCDTGSDTCVECNNNNDCGDPSKPVCSSHFCVCSFEPTCNGRSCPHGNSDCTNGTCGGGVCDSGMCVCPSGPVSGGGHGHGRGGGDGKAE